MALLTACAQGGLSDGEVKAAQGNATQGDADDDDADDDDVDADDDADDEGSDGGDKKDSGAGKDAGATSGGRDASSSTKGDAGKASSSGSGDAGAGSLPTIKCPSNLVCTSDISIVLSALDPNVTADTPVCAQSGLLPMPVSCKSDDECKSARLITAKCTGSYCIQACTK
jgi:hypothetical protein